MPFPKNSSEFSILAPTRLSTMCFSPVGLALVGSYLLSYQLAAEMMNFGAFVAFVGVNIAAFVHYSVRGENRNFAAWFPPIAGALICFFIWLHLRWPAKVLGLLWLLIGLLTSNGFLRPSPSGKQPAEP